MAAALRQRQEGESRESVVECIVIFYQKGKSKLDYVRKERFRASIPSEITNLTKLKSIVRYANSVFVL